MGERQKGEEKKYGLIVLFIYMKSRKFYEGGGIFILEGNIDPCLKWVVYITLHFPLVGKKDFQFQNKNKNLEVDY